jgi:hypothetical protein
LRLITSREVSVKKGYELVSRGSRKTLKLAMFFIKKIDSKFGLKSIILVHLALNF